MAADQYIYVMKDLGKTFPGGKKVLENIWLSFLPGAKIGVLGPNGAGKSTLLKIMAARDAGFTREAWAAEGVMVGFLEQEPQIESSNTGHRSGGERGRRSVSLLVVGVRLI